MLSAIFTFYIFIIMSIITKIHIYWLQGGVWPGKNKQDLIDKVIGRGNSLPNSGAFQFVLSFFLIMALFPLTVYYNIDFGIKEYEAYVFLFFSLIFLIRAVLMFVPSIAKRATKVFLEYNSKYYAPLCFTLSISYFYLYILNSN